MSGLRAAGQTGLILLPAVVCTSRVGSEPAIQSTGAPLAGADLLTGIGAGRRRLGHHRAKAEDQSETKKLLHDAVPFRREAIMSIYTRQGTWIPCMILLTFADTPISAASSQKIGAQSSGEPFPSEERNHEEIPAGPCRRRLDVPGAHPSRALPGVWRNGHVPPPMRMRRRVRLGLHQRHHLRVPVLL